MPTASFSSQLMSGSVKTAISSREEVVEPL